MIIQFPGPVEVYHRGVETITESPLRSVEIFDSEWETYCAFTGNKGPTVTVQFRENSTSEEVAAGATNPKSFKPGMEILWGKLMLVLQEILKEAK